MPRSPRRSSRPRPRPAPVKSRYFTAIDGLMDGNADVVLKETRQGKTVTAATLDVCYPAEKNSDRKDRFVANLTVSGQTLTGTTQSIGDKLPVTVKLTRKQTGDSFEFRGQISIGQTVTEVVSTDNTDLSEKEYQDSQTSDDGITATPKDFTDVSPESIGVKVKLEVGARLRQRPQGAGSGSFPEQPLGHLRRIAQRRADHQPHRRSRSRRRADRQGQIDARRGRGRLDQRRGRDGSRDPLLRRRVARWRQGQPRKARRGDFRRAEQDAGGKARVVGLERQYRQVEADVQAAKPGPAGARADRDRRDHSPGIVRQARRIGQADAVGVEPGHHDGGRRLRAKAQRHRGFPPATRKAASRRTTMARSRR